MFRTRSLLTVLSAAAVALTSFASGAVAAPQPIGGSIIGAISPRPNSIAATFTQRCRSSENGTVRIDSFRAGYTHHFGATEFLVTASQCQAPWGDTNRGWVPLEAGSAAVQLEVVTGPETWVDRWHSYETNGTTFVPGFFEYAIPGSYGVRARVYSYQSGYSAYSGTLPTVITETFRDPDSSGPCNRSNVGQAVVSIEAGFSMTGVFRIAATEFNCREGLAYGPRTIVRSSVGTGSCINLAAMDQGVSIEVEPQTYGVRVTDASWNALPTGTYTFGATCNSPTSSGELVTVTVTK